MVDTQSKRSVLPRPAVTRRPRHRARFRALWQDLRSHLSLQGPSSSGPGRHCKETQTSVTMTMPAVRAIPLPPLQISPSSVFGPGHQIVMVPQQTTRNLAELLGRYSG